MEFFCAKSIGKLKDSYENMGANLLKEVSSKTNESDGDGTSTSTVLAYAMAKEGMKAVNGGVAPISLKRGIDKATEKVVEEISKVSKPIESNEDLIHIATISANNDESIGSIIAEAVEKVGTNGVITTGESSTSETTIEFVEGMQFDRGMMSPYFTTDNTNGFVCEYKNPYVLVTDKKHYKYQ